MTALRLAPLGLLLAAQGAADPDLQRPGLWELTVTVVSAEAGSGDLAPQVRDMIGRPIVSRRCIADATVRLGDRHPGTPCAYTRVEDEGATVSRTVQCGEPGDSVTATMEVSGSRSPERYSWRIRNRGYDRASGRMILDSVLSEEGRRLGDCAG